MLEYTFAAQQMENFNSAQKLLYKIFIKYMLNTHTFNYVLIFR